MEFDSEKRMGFLVDFAWKGAKDKEVPIHVYEHTLSRLGFAMPVSCVHSTVVSDAHRGVARLGDVFEQANRIWRVSDDPGRCAPVSEGATSVRPFLQLFQSFRLDRPRLGPSRGRG